MKLKPDTHAGKAILRGVTQGRDGLNHQNETIIFPPTIKMGPTPVVPLTWLISQAQEKVQVVIEKDAPPQLAGQVTALQVAMRKALNYWMKRAVLNERERIRAALEKHGLTEAQHAMMDNTDG